MCARACASRGMRVCWCAEETEPCTNSEEQCLQGFIWTCSCAYGPARLLTLSRSRVNAAWLLRLMCTANAVSMVSTALKQDVNFAMNIWFKNSRAAIPSSTVLHTQCAFVPLAAGAGRWKGRGGTPKSVELHLFVTAKTWGRTSPNYSRQGQSRQLPWDRLFHLTYSPAQPPHRSIRDGYCFKAWAASTQIKLLPLFPSQQ